MWIWGYTDLTHMMYRTMKEMAADWNWPCNAEKVSMEIGEKLNGVKLVLIGMVIIVAWGIRKGSARIRP